MIITGLLYGTLDEIKRIALFEYWSTILLGSLSVTWIRCVKTVSVRPADSDDEDDDGMLPTDLDYVNPLHRLTLFHIKPRCVEASKHTTVMSIVISFIGAPENSRLGISTLVGVDSTKDEHDGTPSRTCRPGTAAEFGIDL